MNIFFLDNDPTLAAQYHVDRHVVKMIVESAQLMCTAINYYAGAKVTPYKTTHINHPCGKWIRESMANFDWVYELTHQLNLEYKYRYNKSVDHLSYTKMVECDIKKLATVYYPTTLPNTMTAVALAMPDDCKKLNPIDSYRAYYTHHKQDLFKWTRRGTPYWVV